MRVTFVCVNYPPSIGGAQLHVQQIAERLVALHGHDVQVITTDALGAPAATRPGRATPARETRGGVQVIRARYARRLHTALRHGRRVLRRLGLMKTVKPTPLNVGPLSWSMLREVRRAARRSDVLVGVAAPFVCLWYAERAAARSDAAYVAMPLLHLSMRAPRPWVLRSLRSADACTASTEFERRWLVDHGVADRRLWTLPPGCDASEFPVVDASEARRRSALPERATVGYIGRMAAQKGVDTLASAMELIWASGVDVTLLLAGNHSGWSGYDDVVARLRIVGGDRLVVRDNFSDDEKPWLFASCDVIAFPSRQESFGMVTLEAWSAARPIVAADIPAVASVIRDGVDGDLVPLSDAELLAERLLSLLADPDRRHAYGEAGRARAEADFGWNGIAERWNDMLTECGAPGAAVRR